MDLLIIFLAKYLVYIEAVFFAVFFLFQPKIVKRNMLVFALVSLPLIYALSLLAGAIYYNPRPFVVQHFIPLVSHSADNGFPSDHTLLASALAVCLIPFSRKYGSYLFFVAILVAVGRVTAGVHHIVDVIASMIISGTVGLLVYTILKRSKILQNSEQKL